MQLPLFSTMEWFGVGDQDAHLVRGGGPVADLVAGERDGPGVQEPRPVAGHAGIRHGDGVEEEVHVATGERRRSSRTPRSRRRSDRSVTAIPVIRAWRPAGVGVGVGTAVGRRDGLGVGTAVGDGVGAIDGATDGAVLTTATDAGGLDGCAARQHPRCTDPEQEEDGDATDGSRSRDRPVPVRSAACRRGHGGPGAHTGNDFGRGEGTASGSFDRRARRKPGAGPPAAAASPAASPPRRIHGSRTAQPRHRRPHRARRFARGIGTATRATGGVRRRRRLHRHDGPGPAAAAAERRRGFTVRLCRSRRCSATNAAPSAIECFGCASTAIGRPVDSRTISATSGMRDDPPTRRMRSTPSKPRLALLTARPSAPIVSVIRGRIISSNSSRVRRISVWRPGRTTWIVVSVSDERASFARRHSSRSRAMAASDRRVVRVDRHAGSADLGHHAGEERLVEVDAAQPLHPLGPAELLEAVLGLAQDRGVERPAAEVVDGDDRTGRHAFLLGIVDGGRLGLGQQVHVLDIGLADGLLEEVDLVGAVARRVGQGDRIGRAAGLLADLGHDRLQQVGEERFGAVRGATEDDRGRVAEPALEFSRGPGRFAEGASLGRVADEDLAIGTQDDDRRDRRGPLTQLEDLDAAVARGRGRRIGRSEVDPERIRHRVSCRVPGCRVVESSVPPGVRQRGYTPADDERARAAANRRDRPRRRVA